MKAVLKEQSIISHIVSRSESLTREKKRQQIAVLDLEPIKFKLIKESGWSLEKADGVEKLYKAFLFVSAICPGESNVPTEDIDDFWHAHILDTKKYIDDCQLIFGRYFHHFPYLGLRGEQDAKNAEAEFAATRRRFIELTGMDVVHQANDCGGGGCGGGSCGGGSSCSSASCSGGHSSCGSHSSCSSGDSGHGHGHNDGGGSSDITPIISTCSGGDSSWKKKEKKDESIKIPPPANQPGFWRRILGLSPEAQPELETEGPVSRMLAGGRPGRAEILKFLAQTGADGTRH